MFSYLEDIRVPPPFVLSWKAERKEGGRSKLTNPIIPDVEDGEYNDVISALLQVLTFALRYQRGTLLSCHISVISRLNSRSAVGSW